MTIEIPEGYERTDDEYLELHDEKNGIVISMWKQSDERIPYKVVGSENQRMIFEGCYKTIEEAENRMIEVAKNV